MPRLSIIAPLLLVMLVVGLSAAPAQAQVARNSATFTQCASYPCTDAHTTAGANPFLAVCVAWWHYISTPSISAATWNGLPLTPTLTANNPSCGDACKAAIYILSNPPAATANTSITFSSAPTAAVVAPVLSDGRGLKRCCALQRAVKAHSARP